MIQNMYTLYTYVGSSHMLNCKIQIICNELLYAISLMGWGLLMISYDFKLSMLYLIYVYILLSFV